jgi:hypothetical protein
MTCADRKTASSALQGAPTTSQRLSSNLATALLLQLWVAVVTDT